MAAVIATELLAACQRARHEERSPLLALAGGNTPLPAYRTLAANLGDMALTVIPSDERCVPHDDPACNFDALRRVFADARGVVAADASLQLRPAGEAATFRLKFGFVCVRWAGNPRRIAAQGPLM